MDFGLCQVYYSIDGKMYYPKSKKWYIQTTLDEF